MVTITEHSFKVGEKTTAYLDAGPKDGPLLIFIHGWPDVAEMWTKQMHTFSGLGFRTVAMNMRGYGGSSDSRDVRDFSLERLHKDMLDLLSQLQRKEAVWIGHDWGCIIVWSFAAHFPEATAAVSGLCVPYRTYELGIEAMLPLVNRDIYPEDEYPYGQFDYLVYYRKHGSDAAKTLDDNLDNALKVMHRKADPASYGKPSTTSGVTKADGWFGGPDVKLPDIPLAATLYEEDHFVKNRDSLKRTTFFPATAYYLNMDVNPVYTEKSVNDGVLTMPTLFINAKYDAVCSPSTTPRLADEMHKYCRNHSEVTIDSAHWVSLEKPEETNAALAKWLLMALPSYWPGIWTTPIISIKSQ